MSKLLLLFLIIVSSIFSTPLIVKSSGELQKQDFESFIRLLQTDSVQEVSNYAKDFEKNTKRATIVNLISQNHYKRPSIKIAPSVFSSKKKLNSYLKNLDPYSKYNDKAETTFLKKRHAQRRVGIGIDLLIHKQRILVFPIKGGALYKSGFITPQYLYRINNRKIDYRQFTSYQFLADIKSGEKIKIETPTSGGVEIYTAKSKSYSRSLVSTSSYNNYKVIQIREFSKQVYRTVRNILNKTSRKKNIIFDLRYCTGGDLFAAIDTLSLVLESGKVTSWLAKSDFRAIPLRSIKRNGYKKRDVTVLTSKFTASAAEVFIRALKFHTTNTKIIGDKTLGKCLAQYTYPLHDGSSIVLSAYELLTPDYKPCNRNPIVPDIVISDIETMELKKVLGLFD